MNSYLARQNKPITFEQSGKYMKLYTRLTLVTTLLYVSACTTIIDSATNQPIETDPGERSFGTYLDDQRLEIIASVNINKADPDLRLAHIDVTSFNNVILLTGQVPTNELKLLAKLTTDKVNGVKKVYNELQIKGNTALLVRTNDSWLSTKVKGVFIADDIIDSSKVKVIVEDGVVYLMGLLTQTEADYVASVASSITGVQEVVKVFEYI
ncbi:MAG: osmotically-inducible protein OsmY [Candidatus Endobugula sp.]|jgi:osmotically-inducible protein OsmY